MASESVRKSEWELSVDEFRELLRSRWREEEVNLNIFLQSVEDYRGKIGEMLKKAEAANDEIESRKLRWIFESEEIEVAASERYVEVQCDLFSNVCEFTGNKLDETKPIEERDDEDLKQVQQSIRRHRDCERFEKELAKFPGLSFVPESILDSFSRFYCFTFDPVSLGIQDSDLADRILELLTSVIAIPDPPFSVFPEKSWGDIWVVKGSRLYDLEIFRRYVGISECVSDFCFKQGIDPAPLWRVGIALDAIMQRYCYRQQEFDKFKAHLEIDSAIAEATLTLRHIQIKTGQATKILSKVKKRKRKRRQDEEMNEVRLDKIREVMKGRSNPEILNILEENNIKKYRKIEGKLVAGKVTSKDLNFDFYHLSMREICLGLKMGKDAASIHCGLNEMGLTTSIRTVEQKIKKIKNKQYPY